MADTATRTATRARAHAGNWRSSVARTGLVGKGLLYTALGLLAIEVAMGDAQSASSQGAIERVARAPYGQFLIIVLAITLVALVAWKVLQAVTGDPVEGSEATDRAKYAVKAVLYGGSAATAISVLAANWGESTSSSSSGSGGGEDTNQQAAGVVMDWPAGRWIVAAIGLGAMAYGAYQVYQHTVQAQFMQRLAPPSEARTPLEMAGRIGYAARAGVIVGVGVFFLIAGITHDDDEAKGLSGLLRDLAGDSLGQVVLWALAIGLFLYGLFTLAEARYRRAT